MSVQVQAPRARRVLGAGLLLLAAGCAARKPDPGHAPNALDDDFACMIAR